MTSEVSIIKNKCEIIPTELPIIPNRYLVTFKFDIFFFFWCELIPKYNTTHLINNTYPNI